MVVLADHPPTTLLRAPHMCAKSGVWLEGWSKREAQMFLVVMPWTVVVASVILYLALFLSELLIPSSSTFVQFVECGVHSFLAIVMAAYLAVALLEGFCRRLARCCRSHGPRRTKEGWIALMTLASSAACSYGYSRGRHGDMSAPEARQYDTLFVQGDWPFRLAATGEFFVQLAWIVAADSLRCDGRQVLVVKKWAYGVLPVLWLFTFVGPKEPNASVGITTQALIAIGYNARVLLSLYAWGRVCRNCAGYVGCLCACCPCWMEQDWKMLDDMPCTPGPDRLRQLTYYVLCRPPFLLLVNLPLGYPLLFGAGLASTLRCCFALLLAVALRPASRYTMDMHELERETKQRFDVALAMRLCDFAYETYVGPPSPASVVVTGCVQHEWLNGEYFQDSRDASGYAIYSMAVISAGGRGLPAGAVGARSVEGSSTEATESGIWRTAKVYLRRARKDEWVLSSCQAAEKDGERWAFVSSAASVPSNVEGTWCEIANSQTIRNPRVRITAGAGSAIRRFERHGNCRATDAQWLLVEEEGPLIRQPPPSTGPADLQRAAAPPPPGTGRSLLRSASMASAALRRTASMRSSVSVAVASMFAGGANAPPPGRGAGSVAASTSDLEGGAAAPGAAEGESQDAAPDPNEVTIVVAFRGTNSFVNLRTDANFMLQNLADNANTKGEGEASYVHGCGAGESFDLGNQVGAEVEIREAAAHSAAALSSPARLELEVLSEPFVARAGSSTSSCSSRRMADAAAAEPGRRRCVAPPSEATFRTRDLCRYLCAPEKCCAALCKLTATCLCLCVFPFQTSDHEGDDEEFCHETFRKAKVHVGFFRVYASVRDEVVALLQERLEVCSREGKRARVYVTGHSLGGAMASLCALDLASMGGSSATSASSVLRDPVVFTFGSPRIGNASFRSIYNVLVPSTFRVVGGRDIVPTLPPSIRYRQIGREVWLDDAGELTFVMSWAMRHILPPRDCVQHHLMSSYFDLLRKAFRRLGGRELPPIYSFERNPRQM